MTSPAFAVTPRKAHPVQLRPVMRTTEALDLISHECIDHWRSNVDGVLDGDAESLHQLRVGVRRFRAGFSLLRMPVGDPMEMTWLAQEIRALAIPFGVARDLDVFLGSPGSTFLKRKKRDRLVAQRDAAYESAVTVLRSDGWADTWRHVERFLIKAPKKVDRDPRISDTAPDALELRWRRVVKRGARLRQLSPIERHRVRIEAKKLRYGAQFFASLYATKADPDVALRFADTVAELQDALGELNDAHERRVLLAGVGVAPPVVDEKALIKDAVVAHKKAAAMTPFWR